MVILSSNTEKSWPTVEIATLSKVPVDYLYKVLRQLTRSGLIESIRGARGGYRLLKEPSKLTILEVVNAVDSLPRIRTCPLKIKAHGTKLCALHKRLDDAVELVEKAFAATTLDELIDTDAGASRPCDFPPKAGQQS